MASDTFKIAPGHNQTGNLKALYQLSPPLFDDMANPESAYTEWNSADGGRELDGDLHLVEIGLPSVKVVIFRMTRSEYAYWRTLAGDVTIHCLNKDTNLYTNYNGYMIKPESKNQKWDRDTGLGYDEVESDIIDLEAI